MAIFQKQENKENKEQLSEKVINSVVEIPVINISPNPSSTNHS